MTHITNAASANPWLASLVRIRQVVSETPGVATYSLVFDDEHRGAEYSFRPGQFNMLYLPGVGEVAISISGDPADRSAVPHTIRQAGNVTRALASLSDGAGIGLRGPFGSSWPMEQCLGKDVIVVAGGIGLAPLRSAILELLAERSRFGRLSLLYGARMPQDLLYAGEYDDWRSRGFDVHITVDRGPIGYNGHVGVVTQLLDRLPLNRPSDTLLLTCGPEVMMWYTIQSAIRRGLSSDAIYVSLERNMNCAVGLCGHCQLGPEFLCKDGPVFPYDRVASILKVHDL
ncbi:MAG: FAD/NAD(P)-binding protein [Planctomycetaceae bacterium]